MSWLLYDEKGRRAQRLTLLTISGQVLPGWVQGTHVLGGSLRVFGFLPERMWHPTFFVAKMSHGWRVFELDVGRHEYVDQQQITSWWRPATRVAFGRSPPNEERRFPTIAAVEMWIRLMGAQT